MTHDEAFLQAILESPDDDTPRLIYADWLTDRDDPRGEFIHVQCRLAVLADTDPQRPALEARERELLDQHQDEWLGRLQPLVSRWRFRRGFLDAVAVPPAVSIARHPIRTPGTVRTVEIDLRGFEPPSEVLELIPESVARENDLFPVGRRDETLFLAMRDPTDPLLLAKLAFIFNRDIHSAAAPADQIREAVARHYGQVETESVDSILFEFPHLELRD